MDEVICQHGLVLQTCVSLVTPEAIGQLTGKDVAVLALATGLHDFGMYLSKDGFESLISINGVWKGVPGLDQAPWSELWETFFAEASRFDGRKLLSLFGNNYTPVRPIPTLGEEWSEFDFLLVGEFLRRYHPRLAHEIAIYGMPAKDGQSIELYVHNQSSDEIMELAGLVARSHGMPLRPSFDYLETRYDQRVTPRGVHMPFLMVLLRVADYFQIQQTRAPTERTEVARLISPISQMEWSLHQSIKDIHNSNDPEAFEVIAEPNDVASFLK